MLANDAAKQSFGEVRSQAELGTEVTCLTPGPLPSEWARVKDAFNKVARSATLTDALGSKFPTVSEEFPKLFPRAWKLGVGDRRRAW